MILYVVKDATDPDPDPDPDADDESGTEGFDDDDDDDDHVVRNTIITDKPIFEYARIFEDYYHDSFEHTKRRLIIMF
jgi:hypothetical protein